MPIVFEGVSHSYMAGSPLAFPALEKIDLKVNEGEFLGVIGHTGSGKSTLMQHLNGLLLPTAGRVLVDGFDTLDKKQCRSARALVGLVFQYPEYQLFEETVAKDVAFGPKNLGLSEDEVRVRVRDALTMVGLDPERFSELSPFDLSGGEKRRAALAGILAMRPKYLALDEPMAGLDPRGRRQVLDLLETLRKDTGCTIIMVSHSMDDVARRATRVIVLDHGKLALSGAPGEVFPRMDELTRLGLSVPQATRLAGLLRARGMDVPEDVVRMEDLRDLLLLRYTNGN